MLFFHIKNAGFLRATEPLVRTCGKAVTVHVFKVQIQSTPGLGTINMDKHIVLVSHGTQFFGGQFQSADIGYFRKGEQFGFAGLNLLFKKPDNVVFTGRRFPRKRHPFDLKIVSFLTNIPGHVVGFVIFGPQEHLVTGTQRKTVVDDAVAFSGVSYQGNVVWIHLEMFSHFCAGLFQYDGKLLPVDK